MRLILASASPRRQELLKSLELTFEVIPAGVDETPHAGETPEALVRRLSEAKAKAVAARHPEALVIAADTVVALDDDVLGKPADHNENRTFIKRLSGRTHRVYTGHALAWGERTVVKVVRSEVRFRQLCDHEIDWYVGTGEGLDKAGGYAIQGYGAAIVEEVHGCYYNVVGLSIANLIESAKTLGVELV